MPPLRCRDCRATSPIILRRITRDLAIDVSLANSNLSAPPPSETQELESALAAKENELSSLTSPSSQAPYGTCQGVYYRLFHPSFPEIVGSFQSFNAMKTHFLTYLTQTHLLTLIPESKLYRSVCFPYG